MADLVRVLRVVEFTGPRAAVEDQVSRSLHGEKRLNNGVTIRAATVGSYPEMLDNLPVVEGFFGGPSGKCITCHHDIMHHGIKSSRPGCAIPGCTCEEYKNS